MGAKKNRAGPWLTDQRHREEPRVDKLIEAHPIWYRAGIHYHLNSSKIRGFLIETFSEVLQN